MSDKPFDPRDYFTLFNEIGIISQLSRTLLEARLPQGVLSSHFAVLNHLVRVGDGPTPLDLAQAFQVPKTTLSHTLALLEKRGWIAMRPNPNDKRSKQVWITPEGRAFRDESIDALSPMVERLSPMLDPELIETILPRLVALRKTLDENRGI